MSDAPRPPPGPPLGSWPRFYVLTCVVASLYIVLLYWFTITFSPGGGA